MERKQTQSSLNVYPIIGMSPGNSYFKDKEIEYLLKTTLERFDKVAILIADIPAISTYVALGYPENRARRDKAVPQGNALKNRVNKIMSELGYNTESVKIIDWKNEIENNTDYQKQYKKILDLYANNDTFNTSVNSTTESVLKNSKRVIDDIKKATKTAAHYLLSELAFLEFAPSFLKTKKVVYIYHKNWRVYEDYIAGKFDTKVKQHMDFLLTENPYETYNPIWEASFSDDDLKYYDILDRINKTKILRIGFTNYSPAFTYNKENYNDFSGIFYEVIVKIAQKHGWSIRWTEETGYGVIVNGLDQERFDFFGSTVWPTPERILLADFTESLYESEAFLWSNVGFKKTNDQISNDRNIRIAIKENDISDSIVQADFPQNRRILVPQLSDTMEMLNFVVEDRADIAIAEELLVKQFNEVATKRLIKTTHTQIRTYQNSFMVKKGEGRLKQLLNQELIEMKENGFIAKLIKKYTKDETYSKISN